MLPHIAYIRILWFTASMENVDLIIIYGGAPYQRWSFDRVSGLTNTANTGSWPANFGVPDQYHWIFLNSLFGWWLVVWFPLMGVPPILDALVGGNSYKNGWWLGHQELFPRYWEFQHPNWLTVIFFSEGWHSTTNQSGKWRMKVRLPISPRGMLTPPEFRWVQNLGLSDLIIEPISGSTTSCTFGEIVFRRWLWCTLLGLEQDHAYS